MSERQTKAGNQITLSLTLTLSHYLTLSHSHTHSISHSITLDMLNNFCFHLYAQNSPSHFLTLTLSRYLTLTLSHSHTLSISHSITLDMLNNFCFHLYAQKSLFIVENCNVVFSWEPALWMLMSRGADADDDDEVQKKTLQFSAINSDFWA